MTQDSRQMMRQFERMKDLDSKAFVEIPQKQIVEHWQYQRWLVGEIEMKWMKEFNQGNEHYHSHAAFNQESGIGGYFGGVHIGHCKLYRYDGTGHALSEDDYRAKRGFLIRNHYGRLDVVEVQLITRSSINHQ